MTGYQILPNMDSTLNGQRVPQAVCISGAELLLDPVNSNRILPTHKLSGLPLLTLPIDSPQPGSEQWMDYDHCNYPRSRKELQGFGGAAVRCSRGQDLPRWLHNRKHSVFPEGPILPRSTTQKYIACVLACADFIPRQAIDLTRDGSYDIVEMTDRQIESMARSRTVHIEDAHHADGGRYYRNTIGKFFAFYAVSQRLEHVSAGVIEDFIHTSDERRKKELGHLLLNEALDVALQPVRRIRLDLQDQGLVQLRRTDPHATVRKFFLKSRYSDYIPELHDRLWRTLQAA